MKILPFEKKPEVTLLVKKNKYITLLFVIFILCSVTATIIAYQKYIVTKSFPIESEIVNQLE